MRIGGFTKQSFIDYEGKIAAVIFIKGCNFRCGYCHNSSLVLPELIKYSPDISETEIFDYLGTRNNWLEGVVITGGEPTIHKDLVSFISLIKRMGYDIKLDTNGTNPNMLKHLIDNRLIDYVAMDIKTIMKADKYSEITGVLMKNTIDLIRFSLDILRNSHVPYQLRTTKLPGYHTLDIIDHMKSQFEAEHYVIQEYRDNIDIIKRVIS